MKFVTTEVAEKICHDGLRSSARWSDVRLDIAWDFPDTSDNGSHVYITYHYDVIRNRMIKFFAWAAIFLAFVFLDDLVFFDHRRTWIMVMASACWIFADQLARWRKDHATIRRKIIERLDRKIEAMDINWQVVRSTEAFRLTLKDPH
jgi:hypothetical protein